MLCEMEEGILIRLLFFKESTLKKYFISSYLIKNQWSKVNLNARSFTRLCFDEEHDLLNV